MWHFVGSSLVVVKVETKTSRKFSKSFVELLLLQFNEDRLEELILPHRASEKITLIVGRLVIVS